MRWGSDKQAGFVQNVYTTFEETFTSPLTPHHNYDPPTHTSRNMAIPTSTSVVESAVINAPLAHVWHFIKLQDFSKFWSALQKSEFVTSGTSQEADVVKWAFKDGTTVEVKQEEHSVSLRTVQ